MPPKILLPLFALALAPLSMAAPVPMGVDSTTTPVLVAEAGANRVKLKWTLCPTCDSYEIFRSAASSGPWTSIARVQRAGSHTDTGLTSRTLYFYRVSGFRGQVEGDFSDVLQAITLDSLADTSQAKKKPTQP
ncbi:MAG TPA: fibronectin type III domain-containing protein [Fibrobacteria bacterium]|nr:fibronectin type III domain-containing protein [Fibrobacteria bacterium]HOX51605.1 fibronectin type III domain-containing protein [Fibrobacteria bacterium]